VVIARGSAHVIEGYIILTWSASWIALPGMQIAIYCQNVLKGSRLLVSVRWIPECGGLPLIEKMCFN